MTTTSRSTPPSTAAIPAVPLFNLEGEVIGINTAIYCPSGASAGIGFAVPVERLKDVLPALKAGEEVKVPFLGVTTVPVDRELKELGIDASGLLVAGVTPGSAAQKAGIRTGRSTTTVTIGGTEVPLGGDVIVSVDGKRLETPSELASYVAGKQVGDTVTVVLQRGSKQRTVEVELGSRPTTTTP